MRLLIKYWRNLRVLILVLMEDALVLLLGRRITDNGDVMS